jgi:hypothetical protein
MVPPFYFDKSYILSVRQVEALPTLVGGEGRAKKCGHLVVTHVDSTFSSTLLGGGGAFNETMSRDISLCLSPE